MRILCLALGLAMATPAAADCQQKVDIEVVPGAHLVGLRDFDMSGRPATLAEIKPARADTIQASVLWRGWQNDRELTFAVAWPEAPSVDKSLQGKPRWIINLGRYEHVAGKYIAVTAIGSRGTWRGRWTLTRDHAIFVGPSPRAFHAVTLALHGPDGKPEAERTFALPDWKAFARTLPDARTRLSRDLAAKAEQCLHPPTLSAPPVR